MAVIKHDKEKRFGGVKGVCMRTVPRTHSLREVREKLKPGSARQDLKQKGERHADF